MRHRSPPRLGVFFLRRYVPGKRHIFIQKPNHAVRLPHHGITDSRRKSVHQRHSHYNAQPKSFIQRDANRYGQR